MENTTVLTPAPACSKVMTAFIKEIDKLIRIERKIKNERKTMEKFEENIKRETVKLEKAKANIEKALDKKKKPITIVKKIMEKNKNDSNLMNRFNNELLDVHVEDEGTNVSANVITNEKEVQTDTFEVPMPMPIVAYGNSNSSNINKWVSSDNWFELLACTNSVKEEAIRYLANQTKQAELGESNFVEIEYAIGLSKDVVKKREREEKERERKEREEKEREEKEKKENEYHENSDDDVKPTKDKLRELRIKHLNK